jgi:hypothetical protein
MTQFLTKYRHKILSWAWSALVRTSLNKPSLILQPTYHQPAYSPPFEYHEGAQVLDYRVIAHRTTTQRSEELLHVKRANPDYTALGNGGGFYFLLYW